MLAARCRRRPRSSAAAWLAAVALLIVAAAALSGCGGAGGAAPPDGANATSSAAPTPGATKTPKRPTPGPTPSGKRSAPSTTIVFVNVGQGDAAIVKSGSWACLIDGGPAGSEGTVESSLRRLGVRRLAAVVVTHPHADHTDGLGGVVADYRPRRAWVGESAGSATRALRRVGARIARVRRGQTLRFGALKAKVLSPGSLSGDANEDSVVLLLNAGGKRFLFTGDSTGSNEERVGSICARGPPLYLLKVAHHGSRYSTSARFLAETDPRFAVISVGRNSYGHPAPQTVAALKKSGARVFTTRRNGAISLTVGASGRVSWKFARSSRPMVD